MYLTNPASHQAKARTGLRVLRSVSLLVPFLALPLAAQSPAPSGTVGEVFAGSELESYLRLLQDAGKSPLYPWSVRSLSVSEVDRVAPVDSAHPWAGRYTLKSSGSRPGLELHLHQPRVAAFFNSAFPYGTNDGAVWAGRGLTTAVQLGATARYGPVSLVLAPVAFRAENASFPLAPHTVPDHYDPVTDWRHPGEIDLPQRFGNAPYARVDWGQSTLRADVGFVTVGVSTANQTWGPAAEYPIVLGDNAPGYLHAFLGSSHPLNLWVGRVHGRFVWGRLQQSPYATTSPDSTVRFMSGLVGVFTPRGVPGLEIGAGRFFQTPWPPNGLTLAHFAKPLETLVKANLVNGNDQEVLESVVADQIASLFWRWVFPRSGLELYGELASEDHRHNERDFLLEPDHEVAYTLGFQKVFVRGPERLWGLRGEVLQAEPSHLGLRRRQELFYIHASTRQGLTQRGQILGSPAAYGGAASTVALDYYHPGGRWSLAWRHTMRQEQGVYQETARVEAPDVMQSLGAEALFFRGRWDLTAGVQGVYDFNRNFGSDVANLNATLDFRVRL